MVRKYDTLTIAEINRKVKHIQSTKALLKHVLRVHQIEYVWLNLQTPIDELLSLTITDSNFNDGKEYVRLVCEPELKEAQSNVILWINFDGENERPPYIQNLINAKKKLIILADVTEFGFRYEVFKFGYYAGTLLGQKLTVEKEEGTNPPTFKVALDNLISEYDDLVDDITKENVDEVIEKLTKEFRDNLSK